MQEGVEREGGVTSVGPATVDGGRLVPEEGPLTKVVDGFIAVTGVVEGAAAAAGGAGAAAGATLGAAANANDAVPVLLLFPVSS